MPGRRHLSVRRNDITLVNVNTDELAPPALRHPGGFLANLHASNKRLMDFAAQRLGYQIEYRADAKRTNGTPLPGYLAVYTLQPNREHKPLLDLFVKLQVLAWKARLRKQSRPNREGVTHATAAT